MELLLVCETYDFKSFTRRATTEAIKKEYQNSYAITHLPIRKFFKKELNSAFFEKLPFFTSYKIPVVNYKLTIGLKKIKEFDNSKNVIVLSSPTQHFIPDHLKQKARLAAVLSDPFHLMGYKYSDTKKILSSADIIFATSQNLAESYLPKYFPEVNARIVYWPNTVDTNIWNINRFEDLESKEKKAVTVGFAGNIMEVTDLNLLDYITSECLNMNFEIAGKLNIQSETDIALFHKIKSKDNVEYLGYINYEKLPAKVYNWDIGILIDKKNELSSYHHHNKLYQYLALGKPVVAQRNHDDYEYLKDTVCLTDSFEGFAQALQSRIDLIDDETFMKKAIQCAQDNNADERAKQFIKELRHEA